MSNPFRRSKLPEQLPSAAFPDPISSDDASNQTKSKRVKIQAPPLSPDADALDTSENGVRRLSAADASGRAGSPPPPSTAIDDLGNESDSTATADSKLDEAKDNTRRNSGSLPPPDAAAAKATLDNMRAPFNPFARTLASSEAGFGLIKDDQVKEQTQVGGNGGRAALDVDAFKNILLTGSATPSPPAGAAVVAPPPSAAPNTTFSRPNDSSSSNTDTSSIFDPSYGRHPESPRASFEEYESASESDDNEHSTFLGEGRLDDFAPPAPPKPNARGLQPKPRGPQTVSFADFDQSIPDGFRSSGPSGRSISPAGILRPSTPRSTSDLNKPLPPPPAEPLNAAPTTLPQTSLAPSLQSNLPHTPADDPTSLKKAPPPPPTRRKVTDSTRPRSSSNLSADPIYPPDEDEDTSSKTAPPPPPSRKAQPVPQPPISSPPASLERTHTNSSITETPKAVPPPPPRRNPSQRGTIPGASDTPTRPGDAFLAAVAPSPSPSPAANAPPAPPPRRTGGSKRTSMDGGSDATGRRRSSGDQYRRPSGNSFDSDRSAALHGLRQVTGPADEQAVVSPPADSQRDILADMSAFQAEIDALRLQHQSTR